MCEYHLNVGDMFRTQHGLGLIVKKSGGYFYYSTIGDNQNKLHPRITTKKFYEHCDNKEEQQILEVILLPDRKYRRKRK